MWSLLISLLLSSGAPTVAVDEAHDFHISRLTANYKPEEGRIECTLLTFVDDVEEVLTSYHQLPEVGVIGAVSPSRERLNLTEPDEHTAADSLLSAYLKNVLKLSSASSELPLEITFLGKERDDDPYGMFIYFYVESVPLSAKLELQSKYLLDLYEDQQNVVVWKLNGESADYDLLTHDTRTCDFER
ncbi:MAG: DUF6702 family protein [Saprospiraceae bacterium]